jgi:polar amino acid transport system substrate-binding protein
MTSSRHQTQPVRVALAWHEACSFKRQVHPCLMFQGRVTMPPIRIVIAVLVLAGGYLTAAAPSVAQMPTCEPDKVASKYPSLAGKTIKIGADPTSPPYVTRDPKDFSQLIGFDADLARAVFDCAGVKYEFFLGGWSGLLPAVISGQIDVMWDNLYYTAEKAKQVDYVVYMVAATGALTQAGNPKKLSDIEDSCGLNAAAGLGTVEEAAFREQDTKCKAEGKPGVNLMTYPDVASGARLVQSGRADVMLTDLALADSLVKDNPTLYSRGYKIVSGFSVGAAIKKGNTDLLKLLADGLEIMQATGKQKDIAEKYAIDPTLQIAAEVKTS